MSERFLLPKVIHGDLRQVKKQVGACVKRAAEPQQVIASLEQTLVPADQLPGDLIIEATTDAGRPPGPQNYWCDVLMTSLDRKHAELDTVRTWCLPLLETPWGGLTFLSQEANGVLHSRSFCIAYVKWMLRHALALESISDRFFFPGLGRVRLWNAPTGLSGSLGELGATNEELRSSRNAQDHSALAKRLLASAEN